MDSSVTVDAPVSADPEPRRGSLNPHRVSGRGVGYVLAGCVALIPLVRMVGIVFDGSQLQHTDYWVMLPRFTNADGSLHVAGLFHFQNEHPMVIAQSLYWLNLKLFSGSNIALGLFVVGLVVAQLGILALLLWRSDFRPLERIVLLVLASALLFDLTGTWNFSKAMSGTAWFTANLFAVTAIYLRSRDRCWPSFAVAALAAISYGTGIVAWAAVFATGASRRPVRQWWREWPCAVGFAATFVWYRASGPAGDRGFSDMSAVLPAAARILGMVLGLHGDVGELVGYCALIAVPALAAVLGLYSRANGVAGWIGVATFGWLALLEISAGRRIFVNAGEQTRYSSLAAFTWIGLAALTLYAVHAAGERLAARRQQARASVFRSSWISVLIATPLFLGAVTAGRADADDALALNSRQELGEIALRFGFTDSSQFLFAPFGTKTPIRNLLIRTHHYPFVDSWDLDCGLQGRRIPVDDGGDGGQEAEGEVSAVQAGAFLTRTVEITGRVNADRPIRCVVVTNDEREVVGAATVGGHEASGTPFHALAPRSTGTYRTYVVFDGDATPFFVGEIPADQETPPK